MKKKSLYDYFYGNKANQTALTKDKVTGGNRFINFWKIYFRKFFKLVTVNLIYTVLTYPLFSAALVYLTAYSETLQNLLTKEEIVSAFPWFTIMISGSIEVLKSDYYWVAYIIFGCSALIYGPLTAGYFYYLRNSAREEHAWFSDIYTKGKKNWKQGILFGVIDILIVFSLLNYILSYSVGSGFAVEMYQFTKFLAFFLGILYFIMRFYIYTMLVTFDLRFIQLMKNGMIFLFINLKWNLLTLVYTIAAFFVTFCIHPVASFVLFPVFFLTFVHFAGVYDGYNVIDKYMVQPALEDEKKANPPKQEDPVFTDK